MWVCPRPRPLFLLLLPVAAAMPVAEEPSSSAATAPKEGCGWHAHGELDDAGDDAGERL